VTDTDASGWPESASVTRPVIVRSYAASAPGHSKASKVRMRVVRPIETPPGPETNPRAARGMRSRSITSAVGEAS